MAKAHKRYLALSALSGCVWGALAWTIFKAFGADPLPWPSIAASPLIGLLVGVLIIPFHKKSDVVRLAAGIGSLFIATVLFSLLGTVLGVLTRSSAPQTSFTDLLLGTVTIPVLLVVFPPFWILFTFAVLNTWWLGRRLNEDRLEAESSAN